MYARFYLFVPGDRPERFEKACASSTDVVILDLEDAVTPECKGEAREAIRQWLIQGSRGWVRLNGIDTAWFEDFCSLLDSPGLLGVSLPNAEIAVQLSRLAERLPEPLRMLLIIEIARGIWNADDAAPKFERLAFGSVVFPVDTGIDGDGPELLYARSRVDLASAMARIGAPVDGVTVKLDALARLGADVLDARRMEFGGKLSVPARQGQPINPGVLLAAEEVTWPRDVMAIVEAHKEIGGISLDDTLFDLPVILRGWCVLDSAAAA